MTRLRLLVALVSNLLPRPLRRRLLAGLLGWDLPSDARIGFCLIGAAHVTMAPGGRIGHLTVILRLEKLELGERAGIGRGNWVSAAPISGPFFSGVARKPELRLGRKAAITSQHVIDCADAVTIGAFTTVGGWRSQILTHAISFDSGRQPCRPVSIGARSFVGTGCILLPGTKLAERSVLPAGSVLTKPLVEANSLDAGAPARRIGSVDGTGPYLPRTVGLVP